MNLDDLRDYVNWTDTVWSGKTSKNAGIQDTAVMGMGLSGECSEVMEILQSTFDVSQKLNFDVVLLKKELGDVIYYWARICQTFGLDAAELWPENSNLSSSKTFAWDCLELVKQCGRVTETLKKEIRDSAHSAETLSSSMRLVVVAWTVLCERFGLEAEDILEMNRVKVNG